MQDELDSAALFRLRNEFGQHKEIPNSFEKQILTALSFYPELKAIHIRFIVKKARSPLLSRPTIVSGVFSSAKNRTYLVLISNNTSPMLEPILLKNLPFNAQIGVLGHELGHISYFISRSCMGMLRIAAGHLSRSFLDRFEFENDRRTIDHGLGWQLLSWSEYVRKELKIEAWKGLPESKEELKNRRERYMNPPTIRKILAEEQLYR
jgi:hypothetical protein